MKNQALFSSKDERKKLKCRLLQFLFGTLRVKELCLPQENVKLMENAEVGKSIHRFSKDSGRGLPIRARAFFRINLVITSFLVTHLYMNFL